MIWLSLTLLAFALGVLAQTRFKSPLLNPTLLATVFIGSLLLLTRTPYETYTRAVEPISAFLAPAVVALAVPLYRLRGLLARQWRALVLGGAAGTLVGVAVDSALPHVLGLSVDAQRALATAPATSPVALQLAQITGADPALAATLAVLSGLLGALILPAFLNMLGMRHPLARGLALGAVAHGIGTARARAREEGELTGAASSIGMGLAALVVTLVVAARS